MTLTKEWIHGQGQGSGSDSKKDSLNGDGFG